MRKSTVTGQTNLIANMFSGEFFKETPGASKDAIYEPLAQDALTIWEYLANQT